MSHEATESTLSTFTAGDGDNLAVQDWPLPHGLAMRGAVLLVHGLGEHAGRYDRLARALNDWGFGVRGYDQVGHGESGGVRGGLPSDTRLVEDLADMVESMRLRVPPRTPVIVLGHSMGGLVAALYAAQAPQALDALVLSSPALDPGLSVVQKLLLSTLPRIAPDLRVGNGLDTRFLSHDEAVARAYRQDPLVHDRISARLARFIAEGGSRVIAGAPRWKVPTLLLYAGADRLVSPRGSRAFAESAPRDVVQTRCFEDLYHEIFNERDAAPVLDTLRRWLDARFP